MTTKTEIREYTRRTKIAASAIERLLANEKRQGINLADLRSWAEEISGCGSEVQNLLEDGYGLNELVPSYAMTSAELVGTAEIAALANVRSTPSRKHRGCAPACGPR
jgi:hypothetical protein